MIIFFLALAITFIFSPLAVAQNESLNRDTLAIVVDSPSTRIDTININTEKKSENEQKIEVIKKDFTFRRQVGVSLGVMTFFAFILLTVQNLNPE